MLLSVLFVIIIMFGLSFLKKYLKRLASSCCSEWAFNSAHTNFKPKKVAGLNPSLFRFIFIINPKNYHKSFLEIKEALYYFLVFFLYSRKLSSIMTAATASTIFFRFCPRTLVTLSALCDITVVQRSSHIWVFIPDFSWISLQFFYIL